MKKSVKSFLKTVSALKYWVSMVRGIESEKELHVNKSTCIRLLNKLVSQQLLEKVGQSSAIKIEKEYNGLFVI